MINSKFTNDNKPATTQQQQQTPAMAITTTSMPLQLLQPSSSSLSSSSAAATQIPTPITFTPASNLLQSSSAHNLDYFNKYNHLSLYQKQQNIQAAHNAYNTAASLYGRPNVSLYSSGISSPSPYLTATSAPFNNFNHLNNNGHLKSPSVLQAPILINQSTTTNANVNNRHFFPNPNALPAPFLPPPSSSQSQLPYPNYLYSVNNSTRAYNGKLGATSTVAPSVNLFKQQTSSEQDVLDDGFLHLFANRSSAANSSSTSNIQSLVKPTTLIAQPSSFAAQPRLDRSNSLFDLKSAGVVVTEKNDVNKNLIDLESLSDLERLNKLSMFELFDPLVEVKSQTKPSPPSPPAVETVPPKKEPAVTKQAEGRLPSEKLSSGAKKLNNDKPGHQGVIKQKKQANVKLDSHEKLVGRIESLEIVDINNESDQFEELSREIGQRLAKNNGSMSTNEELADLITFNQVLDYSPYLTSRDMNLKLTIKVKIFIYNDQVYL
jgi:hypothetical protein